MPRARRSKYKRQRARLDLGGSTPRPWKNPTPNSTGTDTWDGMYVPLREQRRRRLLDAGEGGSI